VTWVMWNLVLVRLKTVEPRFDPFGDSANLEARYVRSEIVLVSLKDRCTVCPERTIGVEIILDTPDATTR
jgi:hypothetical protein